MVPAGQGIERDLLGRLDLFPSKPFAAQPSRKSPGPVNPNTLERLVLEEASQSVNSAPPRRMSHEAFFDPVGEDVLESLDLGVLFVTNGDGLVPPTPELLAPVGESTGLLGEVAVEEVHECGECVGVGCLPTRCRLGATLFLSKEARHRLIRSENHW